MRDYVRNRGGRATIVATPLLSTRDSGLAPSLLRGSSSSLVAMQQPHTCPLSRLGSTRLGSTSSCSKCDATSSTGASSNCHHADELVLLLALSPMWLLFCCRGRQTCYCSDNCRAGTELNRHRTEAAAQRLWLRLVGSVRGSSPIPFRSTSSSASKASFVFYMLVAEKRRRGKLAPLTWRSRRHRSSPPSLCELCPNREYICGFSYFIIVQ